VLELNKTLSRPRFLIRFLAMLYIVGPPELSFALELTDILGSTFELIPASDQSVSLTCISCPRLSFSICVMNTCRAQPASANQNIHRQAHRTSHGSTINHTIATSAPRSTLPAPRKVCTHARRTNRFHGSFSGICASYSFVKRKGVLHSSQCFLLLWLSHCMRQS